MARKLHMVERRHSNQWGQMCGGCVWQAEQQGSCSVWHYSRLVVGGLAGVAGGVSVGGEW